MKQNNNKILIDEFKRTFPIYILGMVFHGLTIYILYKIPNIIGNILDLLISGNFDKSVIINEAYSLIFYSIIMIIPRIIYRALFFRKARISDTYLRKKVIEHLQEVKPEYFEKENKGTFLAYLSKEILSIRRFLGNFFFDLSRLIIAPIIGLLVIGQNCNNILAWIILPIFVISIFALFKLYKKIENVIEEERIAYIDLSKTIEQNTSGFSLMKLDNEQSNQRKKFKAINKNIYDANYKVGYIFNFVDLTIDIMYGLSYSLGFAFGLVLIQKGKITVGELTAYISCITIAISEIIGAIQPLMNGLAYFKQATRRFNYFFNLESYKKTGKDLENIQKIEIKNLSYSYENNQNYAIRNINMTIKKGEKIGIVGKVGSGKTTLMNIIAGFYEVENNKILINDIDINEYSRDAIFKNVGYAMQSNIITDDTIKNNIDIKNQASENELYDVAKKADIYQDIENMQDGLQTQIGENGVKVSGGQKQRIQVARNLLDVRSINIFDDTLSALDIQTEKNVLEQIENQVGENTLIIISNKISMMENMDKVYMLIDGVIVDERNTC